MAYPKLLFPLILVAGAALACGGSDNDKQDAGGAPPPPIGAAPFAPAIEAAGYHAILVRDFPSEVPTREAKVVVYRSNADDDHGGIIYVNYADGIEDRVVWHWYFDDDAPDSITTVELNDDGLWDVRFHSGGKTRDFVQDTDFTFVSRGRSDMIATNARSSHPENLWRAFDGDSITVWQVNTGGEAAWVDVPVPLGASEGVLSVQLGPAGRPGRVKVNVNGKNEKTFDLEMTLSPQVFQLPAAVAPGAVVRLEFPASQDGSVGVSEVGIR